MSIWKFLGIGREEEPDRAGRGSSTEAMRELIARLERLPPERARYVAQFAYILGRVAHADLSISESETRAMEREVHALGSLNEAEAVLVVEIAKAEHRLLGATESYSVTREFAKTATQEQKLALLECLFAVSASDAEVSGVEENEIRRIVKELDLSHADFIAARVEFRKHIAVLRGYPPPPG